MAVTFLEPGTDATQDLSFYTTAQTNGTITSDSVQAHTGLRSIKTVVSSTPGNAYVETPTGVLADAGTRISVWVRLTTVAGSDQECILFPATSAGPSAGAFGVVVNTNGTLALYGVVQKNGTTVLSANTWYRLTLSYVITSTSVYTAKLFINGALEITMTGADGNIYTTGTSMLILGPSDAFIAGNGIATTVWYDDVYIDNAATLDDPGAIMVTAKRAFANGTTNAFTGTGTPSGYGSGNAEYVNGNYPVGSDTTTYVSATVVASALTEEYNVEPLATGDINLTGKTIKGVMGWVMASSSLAETDSIKVDGTSTNIAVTSTTKLFTSLSPNPTTYPAGTGTDIGLVTNATAATVKIFGAGVLVAYMAAAAAAPFSLGIPDNPWRQPYPLELRTGVNNLLESTLAPAPSAPVNPVDPTGVFTRSYPLDLRTATLNLQGTTLVASAPPPTIYDQPLPPVKPYPADLRTWISYYQIDTNVPFVTKLDTLPPTRPYPLDLRTTFNALLQSTLQLPFVQQVDALPPVKPYPSELRTWAGNTLENTLQPQPFPTISDQSPPTRPYPLELRTATEALITTTLKPATTYPLVTDVDTLPPTKPYPAELRTATSALLATTLAPPPTSPITTDLYDVPWSKPYALELRTATLNLLVATLAPLPVVPSLNYDWPNPSVKPYALDLRTALGNILESTLVPPAAPVPALDWPNPSVKPYPLDLRTATCSLQTSTLPAKPFIEQWWEIPPTRPYPLDLRTATLNLLTTTLVPLAAPLLPYDVAVPSFRPAYPGDLRTSTLALVQSTLFRAAFVNADQPLTFTKPYALDLRTATLTLITTTLKPAQTFPVVVDVDVLPPTKPYALDLRTSMYNLLTTTLVPKPPAPTITDIYQLGTVQDFGNAHTPSLGGLHFAPWA